MKTISRGWKIVCLYFALVPCSGFAGFLDTVCPDIYKEGPKTGMNKDNIAPLTEADARRAGWKKQPDVLSLWHFREKGRDALGVIGLKTALETLGVDDFKGAIGKTIELSVGSDAYEIIQPLIESNLDTALGINHKYLDPDGHYEAVYLPDGTLLNQGILQGTYNKDTHENLLDHFCSAIVNHWLVRDQNLVYDPTKKCFLVSENKMETSVDCDTGIPLDPAGVSETDDRKSDTLHSLADLLETGEEIVEVREDMREDRRERKEKERAERERKAAEEAERLRQQQLAEQRKKAAQKKPSEKNSDKKTDVRKDEPNKGTPETPNPMPAQNVADVDFSKLENVLSQQISLARSICSKLAIPSNEEISRFNSLGNEYGAEFNRLKSEIATIEDPATRQNCYSRLNAINQRVSSELDPILRHGHAMGYFKNL